MKIKKQEVWMVALVVAGLGAFLIVSLNAETTSDEPVATAASAPAILAETNVATSITADAPVSLIASNALPVLPPAPIVPDVKLSKSAQEIMKLAQAGLGEDVMLAYVANVGGKFNLGSDQIVFLNDIGVSGTVVKSMIQRDAALQLASDNANANQFAPPVPPPAPNPADSGYTPPMVDTSVATTPPPDPGYDSTASDADYFYNSLAPYGNWVYVAGAGVCWQPTVYVANRSWRPYNDLGRWVYSDCGWYWQSDYSWGWAPFHYGRWYNAPNRGWVWTPGREWAPAWVSWRQSDDYCGWAPLPPSAHFVGGKGLTYGNGLVAANFEFGLQPEQYTFIPKERLSDYTPARYAVASWELRNVHARTAVANHFTVQNQRVVNQNIDPNQVSALARTEIRRAEIRDLPRDATHQTQSDRLTKSGGTLVILRPQLPVPTPHRPQNTGNSGGNRPPFAPAANSSPLRTSSTSPAASSGSLVMTGSAVVRTAPPVSAPTLPNMILRHPVNPQPTATAIPVAQPETTRAAAGFNFNGNYNRPAFNEHLVVEPSAPPAHSTYVMPGRYSVNERMTAAPQNNYVASPAPAVVANNPGYAENIQVQEENHRRLEQLNDRPRSNLEGRDSGFHQRPEPVPAPVVQHEARPSIESSSRAAAAEHFSAPSPTLAPSSPSTTSSSSSSQAGSSSSNHR